MIIGLDVGGTHTDVIIMGREGLVSSVKTPTDPDNLFQTLLNGLAAATQDIDPRAIRRAVLSTTLATNLVAQQKLPPVGMIVTAGPGIDPDHYRTNDHYHVVAGAMDHRGREVKPLDTRQVRDIGEAFKRQGIRYAGVVSKFSVRNPEHEKIMATLLEPYVERVFMGHQFSGGLNFPRRIATTYLNAAVYPIHKEFFEAVQKSLAQKGFTMPIRVLRPDGGNMNIESSVDYPAQTILSGPSASVMGSLTSAPGSGASLVLDIGGTTTDMAVLIDGVPILAPLGIEVPPYKTLIRALMTQSIGIGGDSAVRLRDGALVIGPERVGKAMAYGGAVPTPTDAFCVLGMTETGDRERAVAGLAQIARELGRSIEETARKVFETTCRKILDSANKMVAGINSKPVYTVHELWEGSHIKPKHLLVLGGPAPQFAEQFKTMFQGDVKVVPHWQVANAIGCALARTTSEVILYADTAQKMATSPGENFTRNISSGFDLRDAIGMAMGLLKAKAVRRGARAENLDTEVIESYQFNMVRGFSTIGKNIRVRVQVKPGLINMEYQQ